MDLLGALMEAQHDNEITAREHFLESTLTTTEQTVTNVLHVMESKLKFAHSRVCIRTDGASNFKTSLLIPFIVLGNWGFEGDRFVGSFSFQVSGDGKGRVDVQFSYKNRKCVAWVEKQNDLLTPWDFAAALSGGFKAQGCILKFHC